MKFYIKNEKELMAGLRRSPKIAVAEINNAIKRSSIVLQREATIQSPVATGKMRGQVRTKFSNLFGQVYVATNYSASVEYGTKPHYVPTKALVNWATTKGVGVKKRYAVAKAVQKKIAQRGTKANPFMGRAVKKTELKINQLFSRAGDNIAKNI